MPRQPARVLPVIKPLYCVSPFTVRELGKHTRQVVPVGDQPLILAADKLAGQVVVIIAVCGRRAGFRISRAEYILTEGGVAAVFTGQADDPSGSIVFHTARLHALAWPEMAFPNVIVLCPALLPSGQ